MDTFNKEAEVLRIKGWKMQSQAENNLPRLHSLTTLLDSVYHTNPRQRKGSFLHPVYTELPTILSSCTKYVYHITTHRSKITSQS